MAWLLRALEQTDGTWRCSHGLTVYDQHDVLPDALDHLHAIAEGMHPAELFVHSLNGDVHKIGPAQACPRGSSDGVAEP